MKMVHCRLGLLLLFLSLLHWEAEAEETLGKADSFFDYSLCDKEIGLQWFCYMPKSCRNLKVKNGEVPVINGELETFNDQAEFENCNVLLAIQPHTKNRWRIVLQAQDVSNAASISIEVKKNDATISLSYQCFMDGGMLKGRRDNGNTFNIDDKFGLFGSDTDRVHNMAIMCDFTIKRNDDEVHDKFGLFGSDTDRVHNMAIMCDFTIKRNDDEITFGSGFTAYLKFTGGGSSSTEITHNVDAETLRSQVLRPELMCDLPLYYEEETRNSDEVEYKRFNMDKLIITCPKDFTMRAKKDDRFKSVDVGQLHVPKEGGRIFMYGKDAYRSGLPVHCARKRCKVCEAQNLCPAGSDDCPMIDAHEKDFDECAEFKCTGPFIINGGAVNPKAKPKCDKNIKWMLDGSEITSVKCGAAVQCTDPKQAVAVKDFDKMNVTSTLVTCNDGKDMSYTAGDKQVQLLEVYCNPKDGQWRETLIGGDSSKHENNTEYKNTHILACSISNDRGAVGTGSQNGQTLLFIGIGLRIVALIGIALVLIVCCCKRKQKQDKTESSKKGSKESKSGMPSSSGATGGPASSDKSQKKSGMDEREKIAIGIDQPEDVATGISIEQSAPKTANEIKDEERSNPTERSAIQKTLDLKDGLQTGAAAAKKKTTMATGAGQPESSKADEKEPEDEKGSKGATKVQTAVKKGTLTKNVDGIQAATTMNQDGTQAVTSLLNQDGTQAATQQKRRPTRKGTFLETAVHDPSRGPDGTQQASENGPEEGGTQIPTNGTADTQVGTVAAGRMRIPKGRRRTQPTQQGEDGGPVQDMVTAVDKSDEGDGATGIPRDPTRMHTTQDATRVRTTQDATRIRTTQDRTRTRMMTAAGAEDESAMLDPPGLEDIKTCKEPDEKPKDKEKEHAKKIKSKKQRQTLKPREIELNEKEKKIKAGAKRNRFDYPTMRDIESDWDSEKDKDKVSRETPKKKKSVEDKKKKKSKREEEKEKKESKKKEKEKRRSGEKDKDRKKAKSPAKADFGEVTAIDDGPTGNYYTARTVRGDGTQAVSSAADPTQRKTKTRTALATAFDPTETHPERTMAEPTQAVTAQDHTQGHTTADPTQGGITTQGADGTQGVTTAADFTQALTQGADPTQAGHTTHDPTQAHTTVGGDATTQGETRTRVLTGRSRTKTGGVGRTQSATRTRFTQGATTTHADFTQGGATTLADQTQVHTSADPTQAGYDPTNPDRAPSADGSLEPVIFDETQHVTGTVNDPTQLPSVDTQDGQTRRSRTKSPMTARSGTRPGTTQTRTRADFTQGATTMADPTQAATTVGDGTQIGTRTKTRTRQGGTQTATAGDRTQTRTRDPTRARDPTQTETRGEDGTQAQTEAPDGTQVPSKTKTRKTTGRDFTQTATANDPTQTATDAHGTQTQTTVDPTHQTMTAVDPTRTMTAVGRTRTETKEKTRKSRTQGRTQTQTAVDPTHLTTAKDGTQTQTAVDGTGTMTAVDPTHQTATAVDPKGTVTAVDPTRDRTHSATKMGSRTQTATAAEQTQTNLERTKTQTNADETQGHAATTLGQEQTQAATKQSTAKKRTQTATKGDRTQTATRDKTREGRTQQQTAMTSANKTQTTAKDHTQMTTGHEATQGPTSKDPTQTHPDQ
ncbi:hypothetical protein PRIPAC_88889 [Pristionchus pacificus]|uniref:Uncharacterized protein n=1 Tax=Pristionchus pacificus TaxID=54126 RepID=A0A2A6B425_PRIPA|nr:hypothetical protein PRIPAC_88889 [Pristionchus pacificus]|eukprot:PDM60611.1 hypothetical protein PRIPAC_53589 [Pristionchus pacificus]